MHGSSGLGLSSYRRRRRQQSYWRLARYALVFGLLAALAGYAYQVGASKSEAVIEQLRAEIERLQASNTALSERAAAAVQRADEAQSRAQAVQERYEAEVPQGVERDLLAQIEGKLEQGVPPQRLAFVIEQSGQDQTCTDEPDTRRLSVRTPISRGPVSAVRFGGGRIVVTAAGASAANAQGQPEAWFDPAAPITVTLNTLGGRTETVEGVLPLTHAMVVDGREYRFHVVDGNRRGLIEATAQSCAFP